MIFTTKMIIDKVAETIKEKYSHLLVYENFNTWKVNFQEIEESLKLIFPVDTQKNFPLHDDVLKLIIKELTGRIPFSKSYILKNYERNMCGIDYLLFPATKAKRLVILFSGLSGHKTYNRFSWYWDEKEVFNGDTVYLFLNDLNERWYVGTDENPTKEIYVKIIQDVLRAFDIDRKSTFTVGGSMGGYASILFAFDMGLRGAISIHPQITYKSTRKHKVNDWETKIRGCGSQWYDLTDFIFKRNSIPYIYLEYGHYEADREGAEELIVSLQKREVFLMVRKTANSEHVTENPSRRTIESVINLMEDTGFNDQFTP